MEKKYWKKITKREVKDHADHLASLNHEEFMVELGLENVKPKRGMQNAYPVWELKNTPRVKGYHDTWCRSRIGRQLDELRSKFGIDMLDIRRQVLSGRTVCIPIAAWKSLVTIVTKYAPEHSRFVISGIQACYNKEKPEFTVLHGTTKNY